ncbi:mitochondrial ribosomal protein L21 [Brevipalpus obovatus]|uniref:mitochondrial ribosomal protein L21 n=1 Tax=Brevipalpus obovatus TaxID=246614 RepID=UPI003D9F4B07
MMMTTIIRSLRTSNTFRTSHSAVKTIATQAEQKDLKEFFDKVNTLVDESANQRNFAVIHMYGKQKLVHEGDMFLVHKEVPAKPGDRIKIEKCLLFGNENITLIGRPLLDRNTVHVEATIIEKTHSHTYMGFILRKRHAFRRYYFQRHPITVFRINEIKVCHNLNENQSEIQ